MDSVKPKKYLGQHFLNDGNIIRKIIQTLNAEADDLVIEIGPGMGALTKGLSEKFKRFVAVEFDREAVEYLEKELGGTGMTLVHSDFLKWEAGELWTQPAYLIGNLPYNISSQIFFRLLETPELVQRGVFMVQKEVAERLCASPGSKEYGILTVLLSAYFDLKYEFTVSENVFYPKPRVKSAIFSMTKKPELPDMNFQLFASVVKAAFGQRRKTLRNALSKLPVNPGKYADKRAEALNFREFMEIAATYNLDSIE